MDEFTPKNAVLLRGTALREPEFSHENHGERFLRFPLQVQRLSRQCDCLWILATEEKLAPLLPLAQHKGRVILKAF